MPERKKNPKGSVLRCLQPKQKHSHFLSHQHIVLRYPATIPCPRSVQRALVAFNVEGAAKQAEESRIKMKSSLSVLQPNGFLRRRRVNVKTLLSLYTDSNVFYSQKRQIQNAIPIRVPALGVLPTLFSGVRYLLHHGHGASILTARTFPP